MNNQYHVDPLDTDSYKLTMGNGIGKLYPKVMARYSFINRDSREFPEGFDKRLKEIIDSFRGLSLSKDGYDYLRERCYYLDPLYIDFFKGYCYDPTEVHIKQDGPWLQVEVEGLWYRTVYWEVPLMEVISELYFEMTNQPALSRVECENINKKKAIELADIDAFYSEFGSRRRYSFQNQDNVIMDLKAHGRNHMLGTSNVYLAMKHDLTALGTVAHEWFQAHAAMFGYTMANEKALQAWVSVYQGDLGIALPDTFTTDVFFKSFGTMYAKLFDGVRQDSGFPLVFLDKAETHYKKLRINPQTKIIMFSDNLKSVPQIKKIKDECKGRVIDRFGIGTWFTNDVGRVPLNMVVKLLAINFGQGWKHTVKISDDVNKHTGDKREIKLCKQVLEIEDWIE